MHADVPIVVGCARRSGDRWWSKILSIDKQAILNDLRAGDGVIHLDNAGAALMPSCVLETQIEHLRLEAAVGGYESARLKQDEIDTREKR